MPDLPSVAGSYTAGDYYDRINIPLDYHTPDDNASFDDIFLQATIHHELMHSLKSMGVTDIDIPMAAAWGYLFEWRRRGDLTDSSKVQYFDQGRNAGDLGGYISDILNKYRGEFLKETPQSYVDAARMAGAVYALFQDSGEREAMFYLVALGFRLDHESALFVTKNPQLFVLIFKFRRGMYFSIDHQLLNNELGELPPHLRDRAVKYIEALNDDHRIGLIRDKAGVIDMLPVPADRQRSRLSE